MLYYLLGAVLIDWVGARRSSSGKSWAWEGADFVVLKNELKIVIKKEYWPVVVIG